MEQMPFRPGFERYQNVEDGFHYPEGPDVIIRKFGARADMPVLDVVQNYQNLFHELEDEKFGLNVVPFTPVVTGEHTYALVVPKIEGTSYRHNEIKKMTPEHNAAARELVAKQFTYLEHKVETGEEMLVDIYGPHQYMYVNDGEPLLIDVETLSSSDRSDDPDRAYSELTSLESLLTGAADLAPEGDPDRAAWQARAHQLLQKIEQANGLILGETARQAIVSQTLSDTEGNIDEIFLDAINRPENQPFLDKRQLAQEAWTRRVRSRYAAMYGMDQPYDQTD